MVFIAERKRLVHLYFPEEYALIFDLNSEISLLNTTVDQKNEEYVSLKNAVDPLLTRIEEKEKDIDSLHSEINTLQAQIDVLHQSAKNIEKSTIWRSTKPIRKLSNSFRKRSQELNRIFKKSNSEKNLDNTIVEKDFSCNLAAIYNKCKLQSIDSCPTMNQVTDIFIPVCNRLEFLPSLLSSIVNNTSSPFRLFLIDDGSLDIQVYPALEKYKIIYPQYDIITLKNRSTKGFFRSVSHVVQSTGNNFIILNSVSVVPPGWLERLMAPLLKSDSIISASPFTNNDPLSGFPEFLDFYRDGRSLTITETDELYKILTPISTYPEITKGSRFCLGVNKNAYNRLGSFANIKHKKRFQHVLVPDLFIYHTNDESYFDKNIQKNDSPSKNISDYPFEDIRQFLILNFLYKHQDQSNLILFVDHDLGGGANLYRNNYIKRELAAGNHIVMLTYNFPRKSFDLCYYYKNTNLYFYSDNFEHVNDTLQRYFNFNTIILSEAVSFPNVHLLLDAIMNLKAYHNASLSILIHDYFCICPCYTLLDNSSTFCGPPSNIANCLHCLPENRGSFRYFYNHHNIISWRNKWLSVLNNSDNIVCFSNSSREILLKVYPDIEEEKILIRPHDIEHFKNHMTKNALHHKSNQSNEVLTIGILGNIYSEKGSGIVEKMLEIIKIEGRKIRIIVVGRITPSLMSEYLTETGSYSHDELYNIVHRKNIDIFFTPSICPETFSYTSEEIMLMDYPLAVFNLGAPAERAKCYHKGIIISRVDARAALDEISDHWNTTKTI
jgi:glycosyltransferase involved in cell wall biosynthesis